MYFWLVLNLKKICLLRSKQTANLGFKEINSGFVDSGLGVWFDEQDIKVLLFVFVSNRNK